MVHGTDDKILASIQVTGLDPGILKDFYHQTRRILELFSFAGLCTFGDLVSCLLYICSNFSISKNLIFRTRSTKAHQIQHKMLYICYFKL